MTAREIAPLLAVRTGVTALIGGGGKTTLMETLARELQSRGTVVLCTSTRIRRPADFPVVEEGGAAAVREALERWGAVCAGQAAEAGKLREPELSFDALSMLADYVIVEADGSRGLPLKAHEPHEPVIPACTGNTVLVVGASGFLRPIREVCHRPERYAALCTAGMDDLVTPALCARAIRAEELGDRLYINQAESGEALRLARELARELDWPAAAGSLHRREYTCLY